ncbi:hypothetical protein NBC122_02062 [Chryseobacterium salivictor]|uniref:Uncharacterized protein n=1 Tax=Chryseobacterium salivictor TaxID=2547600 RepID=A0A4P6ZGN1_9FLAO|nr:hypothetical protein NBC122_02062 [Chryseobacterium salivictor]
MINVINKNYNKIIFSLTLHKFYITLKELELIGL